MKRYLLLFLTCVSISLSMTSCMPRLLVSEMGQPDGSDDGISLTESLRAQDECRYDFSLKLGRKELSGIMVARTVSPGTVRVVGATYFGMTLFDMTLTKDSYTMNSVAEPLSGKAFASFLAMKLRKTMNL